MIPRPSSGTVKTLVTAGALAVLCSAQPATAPAPDLISETRVYKRAPSGDLHVDLFRPGAGHPEKNRPAIAFFHGGGWVFGRPAEFHEACRRYARLGFVTASFQYRLSINPDGSYPHPDITPVESVKDARSAVRWLRTHAAELGIDPGKIIVAGQSAGGQLAWSTALFDAINDANDDPTISPRPAALLIYSGTSNMMEVWADMLMGARRSEIWSISPYHNLKPDLPPALAFHGREDRMVPYFSVQLFATKTRELGNAFELVTLEGRDHYLGEGNEKYARYFDEDILDQTDAFLRRHGFLPAAP